MPAAIFSFPTVMDRMSFWTWLFPRSHVVFSSPLPREQAVQALRAATARGNLTATGSVVGSVGEQHVHLYHRVVMRNSFKPHFRGTLRATTQGCELRGRFALPALVFLFVIFWLGFCVLSSLVTATQLDRIDLMLLPALLPGVLMCGFGIGLLRLGQHLASDDPAILSRVIRQALQSPPV